ncbi:MAG: hypothetical protein A3C79_02445 [Candidatus Taylorbacteria bacterium RIFCSPHIGHO2_02_FULL_45_28]|nr:MAG: hypothetical protein A3C79_02445 [Candidatus Taylorbacteria bacterium RIFCSPHIGHO2_02_FULL_45_28]OHA38463.1 MAG: hypothetical protein A3I98_00590 [Candidatus Taylorbacteria bacterium RIFCSPLOWO2_02_FULL_45_10b]OHA44316.1 MAG: hypothetical protein A3G04_01635 [Candidatus Taylorbacteria bacterium RIFCSPLOWO2_12_FULL_44_9]
MDNFIENGTTCFFGCPAFLEYLYDLQIQLFSDSQKLFFLGIKRKDLAIFGISGFSTVENIFHEVKIN